VRQVSATDEVFVATVILLSTRGTTDSDICLKCLAEKPTVRSYRMTRGVTRGRARGTQFPRRRITAEGTEMSQQCHITSTFFNTVHLLPKRAQVGTWGQQTCFLPRAPSNLVTPHAYDGFSPLSPCAGSCARSAVARPISDLTRVRQRPFTQLVHLQVQKAGC